MVAIAGNTLLALSRAVSAELGSFHVFTTTSAGADATHVVSTAMRDSEAPVEKYGGFYLNTSTDVALGESRIKRNGFTGSTGDFVVARPYPSTPQNAYVIEMRGTMPHTDQDGLTGVRSCINRAIRKLWIRYDRPFTGVSGQLVYDMGALFWATRRRFIRLLEPDPSGLGRRIVSSQPWDIVQSAETWSLELGSGFGTGQTFWLVVEMPTNARLYLSAAWANQSSATAGMTLDGDACLGTWNEVFQCSLYECMKQLAVQAGGTRKAYWAGRASEQRTVVSSIKLYQMNDDGETLGEGPTNGPSAGNLDPSKGLFTSGRY
jgi:hypothetical protein